MEASRTLARQECVPGEGTEVVDVVDPRGDLLGDHASCGASSQEDPAEERASSSGLQWEPGSNGNDTQPEGRYGHSNMEDASGDFVPRSDRPMQLQPSVVPPLSFFWNRSVQTGHLQSSTLPPSSVLGRPNQSFLRI